LDPEIRMKTTDSESIALVTEAVAPAQVTSRVDEAVWFVAHLVSVAVITAVGTVVALFAIMALVLFAPVFLVLFVAGLRRIDVERSRGALLEVAGVRL
jgi:hypothetical protein